MAIPKELIDILRKIPAENLESLCLQSKCIIKGKKLTPRKLIEALEHGDKDILKIIYDGIAPILLVGGMLPGIGLACNIIDAAFCFSCSMWVDFTIDVVAIAFFEVPGVAGLKRASKSLLKLGGCVKIDTNVFWKILDRLHPWKKVSTNKVHEIFEFFMSGDITRFIDIESIAKNANSGNVFKFGNDVLAKVSSECAACGVVVKQKMYSMGEYVYKQPKKLLDLTITDRTIHL